MRLPRASVFGLGLATVLLACGGGGSSKPDGNIVIVDSPPEAPPIDSPPDAPPLDFSCLGMPQPTTAPDPITVSGTTAEISQGGANPLANVAVAVFKVGVQNALQQLTSDAGGAFASGNITTGGKPFNGFLRASLATYRTTALFPPAPLADTTAGIPVLMVSNGTFQLISGVAGATQDDTANGALFIAVTDCANTPVADATLTVKQGAADVGTIFSLGSLSQQAAGVFIVFNVPPGATDIGATFMGMTFATHSVISFKKAKATDEGTTTLSTVRPGP